MRPPDQDRAAYSRDCITLAKIRRRVESCPFLSPAERASTSEQLRAVIELLDRRSASGIAETGRTSGSAAPSSNGAARGRAKINGTKQAGAR